jgi:hypothetical protein
MNVMKGVTMITLNLPKKQVNAVLVALDAEIESQLGGRPVDWESFPEVAALMMAYYTTRSKFEDAKYAEDAFETEVEDF